MLRSMFSGVSGLRGHQTMMDVIGNNIANVNTVGFKASSVQFQDMMSQMINGASSPSGVAGGTNMAQIGLGVKIGAITSSFTQGASQLSGRSTDLSIEGDGFLVTKYQGQEMYTRAGSLSFDAEGKLVTANGAVVQGWPSDPSGVVNTNASVQSLRMPLGQSIDPVPTKKVTIGGNLDANAPATFPGTEVRSSITAYDQQGKEIDLTFGFKMTAANTWSLQPYSPSATGPVAMGTPITITFDPVTGKMTAPTTPPQITVPNTVGTFASPVTLDFGSLDAPDGLRQFAGSSTVAALGQDGAGTGTLQAFSIARNGVVNGTFSNGRSKAIGQIALATFANPAGLEKAGDSLYRTSANSGIANTGVPGSGGRGALIGGTLEMSNVDLAQEFTNLIVAQRGFQANSRVITTSDELLQDLVQLKR